jgi:hypothetical protein
MSSASITMEKGHMPPDVVPPDEGREPQNPEDEKVPDHLKGIPEGTDDGSPGEGREETPDPVSQQNPVGTDDGSLVEEREEVPNPASQHLTGFKLYLNVFALTTVAFLMMLNASVIATVSHLLFLKFIREEFRKTLTYSIV